MSVTFGIDRAVILAFTFALSLHAATTYNIQLINGPTGNQGFFFHGLNNAGTLVGQYRDSAGIIYGFIDNAGTFATVTDPSSPTFTALYGINNSGQLIGTSSTAFSLSNQTFTYYSGYTVFGGPATATVHAINDGGTIVGNASYSVLRAGLIIQPNGSSTLIQTLPFPGFRPDTGWGLSGVNNAGDIVGEWSYIDSTGALVSEGLLLPGSGAAPVQLLHPAASINNLDEIVGADYIYQNGVYQSFDIANSLDTELIGVNDSGTILGYYLPSNFDPNNAYPDQYFLATPNATVPEPATWVTLALGFLTLVCRVRTAPQPKPLPADPESTSCLGTR